jgi:uncharacterized repeat protein (TIGR02543 family)
MKRISIISVAAILLVMLAVSCSMNLRTTKYSVTFVAGNGSEDEVETVIRGDRAIEPSVPEKDGYTFVEWQKDGEKYDFREAVTSDITLEAVWTLKKYSVTFVFNNGSVDEVKTVTWGDKVSEPSLPVLEGNTFVEWRKDGVKYDFGSAVTSDITLEAVWALKICRVTFSSRNGSEDEVKTVTWGYTVSEPDAPVFEGNTFVEWRKDGVKYDFGSAVTSDITLEAAWEKTVCRVSFDFPEDCTDRPSDEFIIYGNRAGNPYPEPKRVGYAFEGWYLDGEKYDFKRAVTDDITLTAHWTEQYWVVSFILSPSTERLPSLRIRDGEKINFAEEWKPKDLERYVFDCWTFHDNEFNLDCPIRDDVVLTAKWTPVYTVTFDITDGTGDIEAQHIAENGHASLPLTNPESSSKYKTFDYWSRNGSIEFDFTQEKITSDTVLYPVWKDKYTVGGSGPAGGIIIYDVDADNDTEYKDKDGNTATNEDGLSSSDCGWRYLEVAPEDAGKTDKGTATYVFGTNGEYATGVEKGDGRNNTAILLTAMSKVASASFPAAETSNSYKGGGFTDWYLPSRDELNLMASFKDKIGNMQEARYWSSSSVGEIYAYYCSFKDTGDNYRESREYPYYVRLIHQY